MYFDFFDSLLGVAYCCVSEDFCLVSGSDHSNSSEYVSGADFQKLPDLAPDQTINISSSFILFVFSYCYFLYCLLRFEAVSGPNKK
jgi:hypothetical protein